MTLDSEELAKLMAEFEKDKGPIVTSEIVQRDYMQPSGGWMQPSPTDLPPPPNKPVRAKNPAPKRTAVIAYIKANPDHCLTQLVAATGVHKDYARTVGLNFGHTFPPLIMDKRSDRETPKRDQIIELMEAQKGLSTEQIVELLPFSSTLVRETARLINYKLARKIPKMPPSPMKDKILVMIEDRKSSNQIVKALGCTKAYVNQVRKQRSESKLK